jgi:hypothetical protein
VISRLPIAAAAALPASFTALDEPLVLTLLLPEKPCSAIAATAAIAPTASRSATSG